jgi:hypothetical protein
VCVCVRACCVRVYAWHVCAYICTYIEIRTNTYDTCIYTYIDIRTYTYDICMTYTYIHIYIYRYTRARAHAHTHTFIPHVYILQQQLRFKHVYMSYVLYLCICVYIQVEQLRLKDEQEAHTQTMCVCVCVCVCVDVCACVCACNTCIHTGGAAAIKGWAGRAQQDVGGAAAGPRCSKFHWRTPSGGVPDYRICSFTIECVLLLETACSHHRMCSLTLR